MLRFRFRLRPLDEVVPWGDPPRLHWFGLTDGWYWIEADGYELLRRTRRDDPLPYVDYQVVRLWEDVNALTPTATEPVPDDLLPFVSSDPETWVCDWLDYVGGPDAPDHPVVAAALWHGEHYLDLGYLLNPPRLRFWRAVAGHSDEVTLDWRHEDDGPAVRLSFPTADYLAAVRTLDRELIATMRQRVEELERRGGLPGIDIDLPGLRREHDIRARGLSRSLDRTPNTDWGAVREGAGRLLGDPRLPPGSGRTGESRHVL